MRKLRQLGAVTPQVYLAKSTALSAGESVQMFPPGQHRAVVSTKDGEVKELVLTIDADTAAALETCRAEYQAAADAGTGDAPFFDFNHDDGPASAWPKRIFWGGDDPITGGVRAEVEWSAAGQSAVEGKVFRRFSPGFHADEKAGRVTGAPVNFGGLVNRAAFTRIQALFAKSAADPSSTSSPTDETKPINQMSDAEITALQEELTKLRDANAKLTTELDAMKKAEAETLVAAAAKDGRIPPAPEFQAKWVAQLVANPASKELLASLPANPPGAAATYQAKPSTEDTPEALLAKFNELPREEKPAFFRAHRAALTSLR